MKIIVPDTSVIIDGRITHLARKKDYKGSKVIVPEVVVAELESQANKGKESGFKGLEELTRLKQLSDEGVITLEYMGRRPALTEFKDIDDTIRNVAKETGACLVSSDRIQSRVARAKGIETLYLKKREVKRKLGILRFFDTDVMSVHLRVKTVPLAKKRKTWENKTGETFR